MFTIKVPATSGNLGPGFDSIGLALDLYNVFQFEKLASGLDFQINDLVNNCLVAIPVKENLVYQAMKKIYNRQNQELTGIKVIEHSYLPLARGLGSSATAIIGGLLGGNILLGNPCSDAELLEMALEIEDHPDNIVPALQGGLVINVFRENRLVFKKIPVKGDLKIVLIIPDFQLKTRDLRRVLPVKVKRAQAVFNLGRTALLTAVFIDSDWDLLATALEDRLHQDYRAQLIPGLKTIFKEGYQAGARGMALSGSGPTVIAFCEDEPQKLGKLLVKVFQDHGVNSDFVITKMANTGARIDN